MIAGRPAGLDRASDLGRLLNLVPPGDDTDQRSLVVAISRRGAGSSAPGAPERFPSAADQDPLFGLRSAPAEFPGANSGLTGSALPSGGGRPFNPLFRPNGC